MTDQDRVEIRIETVGDPRGAEDVARAIESTGKAAAEAAEKVDLGTPAWAGYEDAATKAAKEIAAAQAEAWEESQRELSDLEKAYEDAYAAIADSATEAGDAVKQSASTGDVAAQSFGDRFFPTFKKGAAAIGLALEERGKMGRQVGGFPGLLMSGLANPWAIAASLATAAAAKIGQAIADVDSRTRQFLDWAGQSWAEMGLAIQRAGEATDGTAAATERFATATAQVDAALRGEIDRLRERESAIGQRLSDDEALAASALRLAKARLDAAEAEGRITKEEAARQKAILETQSAEESYLRTADAAAERLAARTEALREATEQLEMLAKIEAQARAEAEAFAKAGDKEKAKAIDPTLNRNVNLARDEMSIAGRESQDPGLLQRMTDAADAANEASPTWKRSLPIVGLFNSIKSLNAMIETWTETTERVEGAQKLLESAQQATAEAEKKRDAAIVRAEQAKQQAAADAAARAEAARAEIERLRGGLDEARTNMTRYQPGGVEHQIRENDRAAEMAQTGLPTPSMAPNTIPQMAPSLARDEFLRAIADGIEQREIDFLRDLATTLAFEDRGSSGVRAELDKIKAQLDELRIK